MTRNVPAECRLDWRTRDCANGVGEHLCISAQDLTWYVVIKHVD